MINKQMIDVSLSNTKIEVAGPLKKLTVTENGVYKPAVGELGFDEISVETHVPVYGVLEVSENGLYEPNDGIDGFNRVVVNTPELVLDEIEITENGNYTPSEGVDGFNRVVVNIESKTGSEELSKIVLSEYTEQYILNDEGWLFKEDIEEHNIRDYAFYNNKEIIGANFSRVTKIGKYAFYGSTLQYLESESIKSLDQNAFHGAKFKNINLPNCEVIGKNSLQDCTQLESAILTNCTSINYNAFYNCQLLKKLYLPNCTFTGEAVFGNCVALTDIVIASENIQANTFCYCYKLECVDLLSCKLINGYNTFYGCSKLKTLILRNNEVTTLDSDLLSSTPIKKSTTEGFIYVPDELVESYKTATNWVVYADKIKPISELPEEVQA